MKHITEPLSAKEIRDSLGVTDEDLEAARRAIGEDWNTDSVPRIPKSIQYVQFESQQRACNRGCVPLILWAGVFVAGVVIGYLIGTI